MSFSTVGSKDEIPFAIVDGGKADKEIIFIKKEDKKKESVVKYKPIREIDVHDGDFELLPNEETRCLFITGPSGSGKSTFAGNYIEKYRRLYPDTDFYVFSKLDEDKAFDNLNPHRITIDESLIEDPIDLSEIPEHSIVLFDDIDTLADKKLQQAVNNIKAQILEMGRHKDIKILVTSHLANGNERTASRIILNEMQLLCLFPKSGSSYQNKYILKNYFGLSSKQIAHILNLDSRWVCIQKVYPQIVLSENKAIFLSSI